MIKLSRLIARDNGICWLCNTKVDPHGPNYMQPTRDHVIPLEEGGTGLAENIKLAHELCNARRPVAPEKPGEFLSPKEWRVANSRGKSFRKSRLSTVFSVSIGPWKLSLYKTNA